MDYNVCAGHLQPIIQQSRESNKRELVIPRWGLVAFYTKELSDIKDPSTIKTRAESTTKDPTYLA
ncbi:hypothetical protein AciX9_4551 (plasmid) [Granulicella tundricola MP5ACTX9]|uniref:Uncharacterized protein n=1 Tax=Granulicella tundricola (strain ATCC BAA-1859 / DSM 23138 / MP5ACTX9) TaxID=1198114 RepID=E8X7Q2_GRATM|nr:hypothetical protein AciX9_4551 [Granulicella tundricola MP5ACTX9]